MITIRVTIFAILVSLAISNAAPAQCVSFTAETSTRLRVKPFADKPAGDPMADDQEKDVAVGDLDQDGWDDVVVVRKRPFSTPGARQDVLLMNENGSLLDRTEEFAPAFLTELTDARDVFIGDFTGDGWLDVVIANTFFQQPKFYHNLGIDGKGNWLGLADESSARFPEITVANLPGPQFCAVWGGDVNGDSALDIFFSNYAMCCSGTTDVLLINNGKGFFTDETAARLGSYANVAFGTGAEIHDMDNDGDNDIVKISTLYSITPFNIGVFILFNNGAGVFNTVSFQEPPNNSPYMFAVGDLNNDDMFDIYVEQDPQDRVDLATSVNPDGPVTYTTFSISPSPRTGGFGGNTKLADVDNDGYLDVGVAPIDVDIQNCGSSDDFALLRNPGDGHVYDPWPSNDDQNFHLAPHDFAFVDINNDGCLDIFMGLCTGWRVFIQQNCSEPCPADLDGDSTVGASDLAILLGAWGPNPGHPADFNGDGVIEAFDLAVLLGSWGLCE